MKLSEWAEKHAVLSAESSAQTGKWSNIPYQVEMLDAMTDRAIESVTVLKSARVGYTKCINHLIGYHIEHDPCPIMVVQPTNGDAEGFSKDEIAPMLRDTPVLAPLFEESGRRDSQNTILNKSFPGGKLQMVGADSPRGFRRVSIRVLIFDETDGYSATAGDEGDQIKLGIRRTEYFWNRKIIAGSTPTLLATSRVNKRFLLSDQRHYYVPCPHCHHKQVLKWENLRWPKNDPDGAYFACTGNGCVIEYKDHRWMVENGEWIAHNPAAINHAGFHIWAAYSYSPNATWAHLAREWLDCHKNTEERKTFIMTVLGQPYEGEGDAPDWEKLYKRREDYQRNRIPMGGLMLFAGVDVQKDRLEVEIVAYGRDMESWSIDYRVITGDTSQLDGPQSPWPRLKELLDESWEHEGGNSLKLRLMGVDSGYNTNTVYSFVRQFPVNQVIATDGRDTYQMIIGQPKLVEVKQNGKRSGRSVKLWPIGVSQLKTELYGWLKQDDAEAGEETPYGWCHFPEYGEEYFKGITAEEIVPRKVKGYTRYQWEKVFDRNEPLDCRVIARACASLVGIDRYKPPQWDDLTAQVVPTVEKIEPVSLSKIVMKQGASLNTKRRLVADDPYL
jgi:phage terminase large subunit GpA-like protein